MRKRLILTATVCLLAATAAQAQMGGGGGGHRGRGRQQQPPPAETPNPPPIPPKYVQPPLSGIVITGEIRAIDPGTGRVTIAYEPVDALNWPAGVMPFPVSSTELLSGLKVGEKVNFHIESQQITAIQPYTPPSR